MNPYNLVPLIAVTAPVTSSPFIDLISILLFGFHWFPRLTNLVLVAVVRPCVSWLTISTYQCPRLSNHLLVNPHTFQERIGQSHQRDSHLIHFHITTISIIMCHLHHLHHARSAFSLLSHKNNHLVLVPFSPK